MWRNKRLNNSAISLRRALRNNWCGFVFIKESTGEYRVALGTTHEAYIPSEKQPKGKRPPRKTTIPFWDLEKHEWRSLKRSALIGYWIEAEVSDEGVLFQHWLLTDPAQVIDEFDSNYRAV